MTLPIDHERLDEYNRKLDAMKLRLNVLAERRAALDVEYETIIQEMGKLREETTSILAEIAG